MLALSTCLALLAGCADNNRREPDPMLGTPIPGPAALPPPSSAGGSTAALAATPSRPPDSRSGLQISSGTQPTALVSSTPTAPALRPPELTGQLTSNPIPSTGSIVPAAPHLASYEQAQVALMGKGVKWQQLQMTGTDTDWTFSCALPDKQNPSISRTYTGKGPNYLAAMQAVLDQMEREGR